MALLVLIQDDTAGVRFRIDKPRYTIGRAADNDICLDDELVSKLHATVEAVAKEGTEHDMEYYLHDQNSTNHSLVNDEIVQLKKLEHDDVIRIGKSNFRFIDDANDDLDATTKLHKTWIPGVFIAKKRGKKAKK